MSEPKFTPGPWHIGTPPPNGEQTIGTITGLMVAVATTGHNMAEETKANAHLIAAAPEIYAALEEICDCPQWVDEATVPRGGIEIAPHQVVMNLSVALVRLEKARAALAKARGETNETI